MGITICQLDLSKLVLKKYKPKIILDVGPCLVKLVLDGKEIIDVVDEDPLLQQQMVDAGQESVEQSAKEIAGDLKKCDEAAQSVLQKTGLKRNAEDFADEFEKSYEKATDEAATNANLAVEKVWKDYVKTHQDYKKYKIKIAAKIAFSAVGIGTGVAAIATVAVGDVPGLILGIVGTARSVSTGLQTIGTAIKSAQTVYKGLLADIKDLTNEYNEWNKAAVTAKELFKKGIEKFTTVGLQSIKKCESNLDTFVSKLKGVEKEAHTVSRELNKMLVEAEKAEKLVQTSKIDNLIKALKNPFAKTFKSFDEAIDSISGLMTEVKDGQKGAEDVRVSINKLKEKIDNRVYTGAAVVIDLAVLGAEIWGGNTKVEEFEKAEEIVDMVQNGLQGLHDAYQDYFKKG
jgi:hypothetical protein